VNGQGFFHWVWQMVAVRILDSTGQLTNALQGAVGWQFKACVGAYLLGMLLIAAWTPEDSSAFTRFFRSLFLAAFLYTVVTNATSFQYWVSGALNGFTDSVTRAIAGIFGGAPTVTADSFDVIIIKAFAVGALVLKDIPWYSPKAWILGIVVALYWLLVAGATVVIFAVYLLSKIGTEFVIAFGPLFVAMYFFPQARKFFDGWLRCCIAGVLTQIFTIAWLALFVATLVAMLTSIAANGPSASTTDNIVMKIMTLVLAAGLVSIFSTMTVFSAYLAIRIAGGAHIALPSFHASHSTHAPTHHQSNNLPPSAASGHANDAGKPAPPEGGNRQYAFNRSGA
jgi:type IV secretory pathway VirB6-like protein